jgi:hypothetical protein
VCPNVGAVCRFAVPIRDSAVARPLQLHALMLQPLRRTYLYIARGSNDTAYRVRAHSLDEIRTCKYSRSMVVFSIIVCNDTIVQYIGSTNI